LSIVRPTRQTILSRITRIGSLDAHVLSTLLFRGWALLAGLFTMLLVPLCLPEVHQGFYFTFNSLVSMQIFFELGFNYVITQIVSHEASLLQHSTDPARRHEHAAKLASVRSLAARWYRVMAALFAPAVFLFGIYFFHSQNALPIAEWLVPWGILCTSSAVNLYLSPQLAIVEGLGRVDRVARLRLLQSFFGYVLMWMLLLAQAKLWAILAVPGAAMVISLWWVRHHAFAEAPKALLEIASPSTVRPALTWRWDVFPLQWRIALSWVSGYFIFQTFTPFLFAHQGALEAGRAGLALAACTAILGLGMSWVNATAPRMSAAIARGDRAELNKIFSIAVLRSLGFTALALALLIGAVAVFQHEGLHFALRIADASTLVWLGLATLTNCAIGAMAIYLRCHKEEPLLMSSVVMAIVTMAAVSWGSTINAQLPFMLYAVATISIALPWTIVIFLRYWRRPS